MHILAGSVLVSIVFAGVASVMSVPAPLANRDIPRLRTPAPVTESQMTLGDLERRFGRDTLLYFPMDQGAGAAVALQQFVPPR
jgi:hypothetical protein